MKPRGQTVRIVSLITVGAMLAVMSLFHSGCSAVPTLAPNRLLPWNWFHSDTNARLEKAEAKSIRAEWTAVHAAVIEARKAQIALAAADHTPAVDLASRFLGNANGILGQVSPITAAEDSALRGIVSGFLSFQPDRVAEAEAKQQRIERDIVKLSEKITKTEAEKDAAVTAMGVSNAENAVTASKYRRLWFWIWTAIVIYVLIQALPIVAKLFPALSGVAKAASWVAAPAVQAGYSRLRQSVGETLHAAQKAGTVSIETLRQHIDNPIDLAEQKELEKQFRVAAAANASQL